MTDKEKIRFQTYLRTIKDKNKVLNQISFYKKRYYEYLTIQKALHAIHILSFEQYILLIDNQMWNFSNTNNTYKIQKISDKLK